MPLRLASCVRLVPPAVPWSIHLLTVDDLELCACVELRVNELHCGAVSKCAHVAIIYCMRFRCMLHMLDLVLHCNNYTRMLQVYVSNVSAVLNIYYKCFIWMLHILHWLYTYVASAYFKCFIYLKRMLQAFYWNVCICCSVHTHMLQAYIVNVSSISDVCCSKFFIL
jgi:hypothetical protein